ncbi:MAG: SUMF1/EgtB/PvdO family nonheme iron enzyme [Desulfobacteraceae bacterium]|nr:SUMF1/EgtB/PvdO family nonheme iron enzyme [Desulfobacteraceae bacterium]
MKIISLILDALKIESPKNELKSLIQKRFADKPEALIALEQYVINPEIWKVPLEHSLLGLITDKDNDIIKAAQASIQVEDSQIGIIGDYAIIKGDMYHGDRIDVNSGKDAIVVKDQGMVIQNTIEHIRPGFTDNSEAMRKAYLNRLLCDAGILSLKGIDPGAGHDRDSQLRLWAVYTALLIHSSEGHDQKEKMQETRRISALEVADRYQHVVLLGDPGSGKTTFVNFITLCLAGESLEHQEANLDLMTKPVPKDDKEERQPWSHGSLLPVRITLRDFAAGNLPDNKASASDLWKFIEDELTKAELPNFAPHLKRELQEHGGLLMFDGLDEVPEADNRRVQIKAVVEDFIRTFHKCRIIITSRTYAYQKQEWRIPGLYESVLAPFTPGQIRRFIDGWYAHFAHLKRVNSEDAQGKAEILKRAVFSNNRLKELAERPLLLTLMASLHSWRGGSLPERREELYAATVDLLLDWWESPKIVRDSEGQICVVQPSLMEWLKTDRNQMRRMLNELAYSAHTKQPELTGTADIDEANLVHGLWQLSTNPDANLTQLIKYLSNRAGLLLHRGIRIHSFPHRTIQEYLAACHLTDTDYPDFVAELARKEPDRWREVTLLAGAKASRGSSGSIWSLAEALCHCEPDEKTETKALWGAQLAGQALAETAVLDKVSPRNQPKLERVRRWLLKIVEENMLPATERVIAGNSLSALGDPRFSPDLFYLPDDDELGFVRIPTGKFLMGVKKDEAMKLIVKEYPIDKLGLPQHEVILSEYAISKYPVTVAQFRAFIQDSGFEVIESWYEYNEIDNHPVVDVSWNDAVEYCKWLTEKLGERGYDWQIQLPAEAEWEKAARGTDSFIYPWGNEPDPDRANYSETGIGETSPVGCFPKGTSPYGILDISGNVWEWCSDWFGEYPHSIFREKENEWYSDWFDNHSHSIYMMEENEWYSDWFDKYPSEPVKDPVGPERGTFRLFRGGSWGDDAQACRSAWRDHDISAPAGAWFNNVGFRLLRK